MDSLSKRLAMPTVLMIWSMSFSYFPQILLRTPDDVKGYKCAILHFLSNLSHITAQLFVDMLTSAISKIGVLLLGVTNPKYPSSMTVSMRMGVQTIEMLCSTGLPAYSDTGYSDTVSNLLASVTRF